MKCKDCNCDCHCSLQEHSDMYGVCSCTTCSCDKGLVLDETKCCNMHTKEKEEEGTCCQTNDEKEKTEETNE